MSITTWIKDLRWRSWRKLQRKLDESAAQRWQIVSSMPPGPEKDRLLRLHAAIAAIYAANDPRYPEAKPWPSLWK